MGGLPKQRPRPLWGLGSKKRHSPQVGRWWVLIGDFATTEVERVHVYSAIPALRLGCALGGLKGLWRYTQGVPCPGQDFEALAPDVLCRVHVGVGFMAATLASEVGLAQSVAGSDVATRRATLAGVMRGHWDEM